MSDPTAMLVVGGLGVLFAGAGGTGLVRARRLRAGGIAVRGLVVAQHRKRPVIEFTTREGRAMRVVSPVDDSEPSVLPGRMITVYYDPAHPDKISIPEHESGTERLMVAIGLLLLAGLAVYALVGQRFVDVFPKFIPLLMGAVFTGIGWFGIHRTWRIKHGGRANGVVIGSVTSESRNSTRHHAVVRYPGPSGAPVEAPSIRGHFRGPAPPGTPVHVRYDRTAPDRMMLAGETTPGTFWIFGVAGVLLLAAGIAITLA